MFNFWDYPINKRVLVEVWGVEPRPNTVLNNQLKQKNIVIQEGLEPPTYGRINDHRSTN